MSPVVRCLVAGARISTSPTTSDNRVDLKLEKLLVDEDHAPAHTQISMVEKSCANSRIRSSRKARNPCRQTCLLTSYRS